jgi:hypothetical protein
LQEPGCPQGQVVLLRPHIFPLHHQLQPPLVGEEELVGQVHGTEQGLNQVIAVPAAAHYPQHQVELGVG